MAAFFIGFVILNPYLPVTPLATIHRSAFAGSGAARVPHQLRKLDAAQTPSRRGRSISKLLRHCWHRANPNRDFRGFCTSRPRLIFRSRQTQRRNTPLDASGEIPGHLLNRIMVATFQRMTPQSRQSLAIGQRSRH